MIQKSQMMKQANEVSITKLAHIRTAEIIHEGDITVDATVGKGFDTLFLAKQVGKQGTVYGFDIQEDALTIARTRLFNEKVLDRVHLIQNTHSKMLENIPSAYHGKIKAILFNLGFLPGGNKTITTRLESTQIALDQSLELLDKNGILSVSCYPGHPEGKKETDAIEEWAKKLSRLKYKKRWFYANPDRVKPPQLLIIQKGTMLSNFLKRK